MLLILFNIISTLGYMLMIICPLLFISAIIGGVIWAYKRKRKGHYCPEWD